MSCQTREVFDMHIEYPSLIFFWALFLFCFVFFLRGILEFIVAFN